MNSEQAFSVARDERDGAQVISVVGEVDAHTAPAVRETIDAVVGPGARIVVDLTDVTFMDSTGLGVFVTAVKQLRDEEGSLALVIASPRVMKVFTLTGLDSLIPIHGVLDEALS